MTLSRQYHFGEPMSDEDSLAHYGVKGMKWGVRKAGQVALAFHPSKGVGAKAGIKVGQKINGYRLDKDVSGVSRRDARLQKKTDNRQLGRKLQDFDKSTNRSNEIRSARGNRVAAQRKYEDIKSELKAQKGTGQLGKNAYKVAMNRAKNERYENAFKADSKTAGEQLVEAIFDGFQRAGAVGNARRPGGGV